MACSCSGCRRYELSCKRCTQLMRVHCTMLSTAVCNTSFTLLPQLPPPTCSDHVTHMFANGGALAFTGRYNLQNSALLLVLHKTQRVVATHAALEHRCFCGYNVVGGFSISIASTLVLVRTSQSCCRARQHYLQVAGHCTPCTPALPVDMMGREQAQPGPAGNTRASLTRAARGQWRSMQYPSMRKQL